jgi:hypothetical protein
MLRSQSRALPTFCCGFTNICRDLLIIGHTLLQVQHLSMLAFLLAKSTAFLVHFKELGAVATLSLSQNVLAAPCTSGTSLMLSGTPSSNWTLPP